MDTLKSMVLTPNVQFVIARSVLIVKQVILIVQNVQLTEQPEVNPHVLVILDIMKIVIKIV